MPAPRGNRARVQQNGAVSRSNFNKRRQKIIPKKKKVPKAKIRELPKAVKIGNQQRKTLERIRQNIRGLKSVRSVGTGVDYQYAFQIGGQRKTFTLDVKFSYGALGNRIIKIRTNKRRLINDADWAFSIDSKGRVEIFNMKELKKFVRESWGSIPKDQVIHKVGYSELPVHLDEFYANRGIKPIRTNLSQRGISSALKEIKEKYKPKPKITPSPNPVKTNSKIKQTFPKKTKLIKGKEVSKKGVIKQTRGVRAQPRGR